MEDLNEKQSKMLQEEKDKIDLEELNRHNRAEEFAKESRMKRKRKREYEK